MTRTFAAGLVGVVLAAIVAASVLFGYRWAAGNCQAEKRREATERARYELMWRDRHYELSATFEAFRAERVRRAVEVHREVERIVERPVYLRECIDDDGLRVLNAVRGVSAAAGEPGAVVPGPAAGDRYERGGVVAPDDR